MVFAVVLRLLKAGAVAVLILHDPNSYSYLATIGGSFDHHSYNLFLIIILTVPCWLYKKRHEKKLYAIRND